MTRKTVPALCQYIKYVLFYFSWLCVFSCSQLWQTFCKDSFKYTTYCLYCLHKFTPQQAVKTKEPNSLRGFYSKKKLFVQYTRGIKAVLIKPRFIYQMYEFINIQYISHFFSSSQQCLAAFTNNIFNMTWSG